MHAWPLTNDSLILRDKNDNFSLGRGLCLALFNFNYFYSSAAQYLQRTRSHLTIFTQKVILKKEEEEERVQPVVC